MPVRAETNIIKIVLKLPISDPSSINKIISIIGISNSNIAIIFFKFIISILTLSVMDKISIADNIHYV